MMQPDIDYGDLDEGDIEVWQSSSVSKIYQRLRGGLFHCTSLDGCEGIRRFQRISPNSGQFPYTYPQSKYYWAGKSGYVSLFDFGPTTDQECIREHGKWAKFFLSRKPVAVVVRLNRKMLSEKLIPNTAGPQRGEPFHACYIPCVEAWYPEEIPFGAIDGFIIVQRRGGDEDPLFEEFGRDEVDQFERRLIHVLLDQASSMQR
jgi:hypothetical protein